MLACRSCLAKSAARQRPESPSHFQPRHLRRPRGTPFLFGARVFTTNHSAISFRTAAAAAVPPSFLASTHLVDVPSSPPAPLLGARARALAYFSQSFPSLLLSSRALRGSFFSLPSFTGRPPLLSTRCSSKPPIPSRLRLCLGVVRCSCLRLLTGISGSYAHSRILLAVCFAAATAHAVSGSHASVV